MGITILINLITKHIQYKYSMLPKFIIKQELLIKSSHLGQMLIM